MGGIFIILFAMEVNWKRVNLHFTALKALYSR